MDNNNNIKIWVLILGLLVVFALSAFGVVSVIRTTFQQTQQAMAPVEALTSDMATQVAQVLNPTPTVIPDPITIIHGVRALSRLETIQYSIEKVITAEVSPGTLDILFGDRLLFVGHGIVISGVDLEKIEPDDLWVREGVLYVRLPEPEIFIATLDNDKSYIYDRETGLLTHGDTNLETTARRVAEAEIEKAALEDGILIQARRNGENYLYRLFLDLGFPEVIFVDPKGSIE